MTDNGAAKMSPVTISGETVRVSGDNYGKVEAAAKTLLDKETLTGEEIAKLISQ